ncbi:MAG: DMT family transporter [Chromatiales bacterium]|jgi:drug/metabolite transporter (DMT)-like permease|nr:DMT family transporter [Chromatiales bacterium]
MRGSVLMIVGVLMLTVQDAVSKWLIDDFHVGEILFYRGIWAYVPLAFFAWSDGGFRALRSQRIGANIIRSGCNSAAGLAVISAYAFMPLATVMAISFASPLLVTALSVPLLGEAVGWRRWMAVIVGFAGMLLIVRPAGGEIAWFVALPLLAAFFVAARDILTRKLGAVDGPTVILFYTVTVSTLVGALVMAKYGATWPDPSQWALFMAMGLVNGVAHFLVIKAFSLTPAVTLMPLRYLSLVWAGIIGYVVWGDVPTSWTMAGASLVVGSGCYIIYREAVTSSRRHKAA